MFLHTRYIYIYISSNSCISSNFNISLFLLIIIKKKPSAGRQLLPWIIEVKSSSEITKMKAAGRVAREVLDIGGKMIKPGVTTDEIDKAVHEAALARGAYPSPLNYHGFPKSCCTR